MHGMDGDKALAWVESVEGALERACSTLRDPTLESLAVSQKELESAVAELESLCDVLAQSPKIPSSQLGPRLWLLRRQVVVVQAMVRQAAGFFQGLEQADDESVIGYTPRGLESALQR
jgi:hypothetical protein